MAEAPTVEFSKNITEICDTLVSLSVKEAQSVVDCLKEVHGIEPASGGAVIMAPASVEDAPEEKDSFDVVLLAV